MPDENLINNIPPKKKNKTKIILLSVIAVALVGILIILGIVFGPLIKYNIFEKKDIQKESQAKARDSRRIGDLKMIAIALESYYDNVDNNYPNVTGCTAGNYATVASLIKDYMSDVPMDPLNSGKNVYMYAGGGKNYVLRAYLENSDNTAIAEDIDGWVMNCDCNDPAYCIQP